MAEFMVKWFFIFILVYDIAFDGLSTLHVESCFTKVLCWTNLIVLGQLLLTQTKPKTIIDILSLMDHMLDGVQ